MINFPCVLVDRKLAKNKNNIQWFYFHLCVCSWACVCHGTSVEVRQHSQVDCCLSQCGFWGLNSYYQLSLPHELSHLLKCYNCFKLSPGINGNNI